MRPSRQGRRRRFRRPRSLPRTWTEVVEQHCGRGDAVGGHADIAETSVMLAPIPRRCERTPWPRSGSRDARCRLPRRPSENGVLGDPAGASAELGWLCMDAVTEVLVDYFSSAANGNVGAWATGSIHRSSGDGSRTSSAGPIAGVVGHAGDAVSLCRQSTPSTPAVRYAERLDGYAEEGSWVSLSILFSSACTRGSSRTISRTWRPRRNSRTGTSR
ncbi:creatininase family protein [Amycolatopsis sulphurea]|uniref:creatininase family protein n=1 Tax=Amycolatopsis sulphurea TaxID=76022 RepID=UPI000BFA8597